MNSKQQMHNMKSKKFYIDIFDNSRSPSPSSGSVFVTWCMTCIEITRTGWKTNGCLFNSLCKIKFTNFNFFPSVYMYHFLSLSLPSTPTSVFPFAMSVPLLAYFSVFSVSLSTSLIFAASVRVLLFIFRLYFLVLFPSSRCLALSLILCLCVFVCSFAVSLFFFLRLYCYLFVHALSLSLRSGGKYSSLDYLIIILRALISCF